MGMSEFGSGQQGTQGSPDYAAFAQSQVTLNGFRQHYVDVGDGPPVVLIHGSPASSYIYRYQIAALSPRFRVIAPDLLGFGRSSVPQGGTSFLEQSENLRRLLDFLDLGSFRLVVHDWGGPVGLGSVTDRIDRVRQLVLINTTLRSDFKPPFYWKLFTAERIGDWLLVRLNLFGRGLPLLMRAASSWAVREHYARPLQAEGTRKTVLALERLEGFATLTERVEKAVQALHIPVLILWGRPDPYFRRQGLRQLVEMFPHATVREISRGGHCPQEDAPQVVNEALLAFLR
jgi:pimeloyl-ACP methyl ester carboxylesterase